MDAHILNQILETIQPTRPIVPSLNLGLLPQPNLPIVPALNLSLLPQPIQDPIHQREEVQTPPPLLPVDQWHTVVSVQVEIDGNIRRVKWFSDLQNAWMSVSSFVQDHPNENWTLATFQQTARIMKDRWYAHRGEDGFTIAKTEGIKFRAFYEPEENEAMRQHFNIQSW